MKSYKIEKNNNNYLVKAERETEKQITNREVDYYLDESDVWDESLIDEVLIYDKITKKWLNSAFDDINDHSQKNSSSNIEVIRNYLKARYTDNFGGRIMTDL